MARILLGRAKLFDTSQGFEDFIRLEEAVVSSCSGCEEFPSSKTKYVFRHQKMYNELRNLREDDRTLQ